MKTHAQIKDQQNLCIKAKSSCQNANCVNEPVECWDVPEFKGSMIQGTFLSCRHIFNFKYFHFNNGLVQKEEAERRRWVFNRRFKTVQSLFLCHSCLHQNDLVPVYENLLNSFFLSGFWTRCYLSVLFYFYTCFYLSCVRLWHKQLFPKSQDSSW